jgi:hypothetical protein
MKLPSSQWLRTGHAFFIEAIFVSGESPTTPYSTQKVQCVGTTKFCPNLYSFFGQKLKKNSALQAPRVARFFLVQHTKTVKTIPNNNKLYQMATKYTKWP